VWYETYGSIVLIMKVVKLHLSCFNVCPIYINIYVYTVQILYICLLVEA